MNSSVSRLPRVLPALAIGVALLLATLTAAHADKPHFTGFTGPKIAIKAKPGSKAWVAAPIAMNWDSLKLCQYDFVRTDKSEGVFRFVSDSIWVPSAFIVASTPAKGLKPSSAVMVSTYVTSAYGRVVSVAGARAKVAFSWAGKISDQEFGLDEVLPMTGALTFGQPAAYLDNGAWKAGKVVYSDAKTTWLLGWMGKPVQAATADVRALKPQTYKPGTAVWIEWVGGFKPGTVKGVVRNGVAYQVTYSGQARVEEKSWAEVTAPLQ